MDSPSRAPTAQTTQNTVHHGGNVSIYHTRFYSDCLGVFQGGGCRAAAFAGAYAAAHSLGVRFSGLAGTSAGSIVAALLAAGAEPNFIVDSLSQLNFKSLLVKPTNRLLVRPTKLLAYAKLVPLGGRVLRMLAEIDHWGGLYSSEGIGQWVENRLRELVGVQNRPVQFQDLVMPLYVVAGDLSSMKPRVWSSHDNPDQSVAHAVRASCSIPLYFQPVEEGTTLLVDGGLVSNLPFFVFSREASYRQSNQRILLFSLEASRNGAKPNDLAELLEKLIGLVIDGATDVQLSFAPDLAKITIPTGDVQATDFERIDNAVVKQLIDAGRTAADSFIRRELLTTRTGTFQRKAVEDEHEAYLRLAEQVYSAKTEVLIARPNTTWFWELFPTVYYWRRNGVKVICFVPPVGESSAEAPKERQRRVLMRGLGIQVVETAPMPFNGFFVDVPGAATATAILYPTERSDYEPYAQYYSGRSDEAVLSAKYSAIKSSLSGEVQPVLANAIETVDADALLSRLKDNVQHYRNPNVTLEIAEVNVCDILLISRYVRAFRYQQIGSLIDTYPTAGIELFAPAAVPLHGGGLSLVTPPVLEESGSQFVAIEGNTRCLYCFNNEKPTIQAVVVKGVGVPLPGVPTPLKQVRITSWKHPPEERISGFNHDLFRNIERAVRPLEQ